MTLVTLVTISQVVALAAIPMPRLNIAANSTTVSGFAYGGDMAVQVHVAYSATIR